MQFLHDIPNSMLGRLSYKLLRHCYASYILLQRDHFAKLRSLCSKPLQRYRPKGEYRRYQRIGQAPNGTNGTSGCGAYTALLRQIFGTFLCPTLRLYRIFHLHRCFASDAIYSGLRPTILEKYFPTFCFRQFLLGRGGNENLSTEVFLQTRDRALEQTYYPKENRLK